MYTSFQLAKKYLAYYQKASNGKGHGMHSPFVFDFILYVLNNKKNYKPPVEIEKLRKDLLSNKQPLQVEDLGAGSRVHSSKQTTIKQLVTTAVKPPKYGQLLYRMVRHYTPQTIIELGTSLGITTAYMATANPSGIIKTIEGSKEIYGQAKQNFQQLNLQNIQSIQGNFDEILPSTLQAFNKIDLGYIDGNHRLEPTLRYFHQFLQKAHNDTILVFDDIHWSREMEQAWKEIQQHPSVRCTIDLFFLGFVFFRTEFKEKQEFTIRF